MCCCNCPCFYKSRLTILVILNICEGIFGLFRGIVYISIPMSADKLNNDTNIMNITDRLTTAFILDWTSSITATLVIILIVFVILLALTLVSILTSCWCLICVYLAYCRNSGFNVDRPHYSQRIAKALYRIMSLDCHCPCYRARPKFRFIVRLIFTFSCLVVRGVAIYLYWLISKTDLRAFLNFYCCLISLVFLPGRFLFDLYHYVVWWCYTPQSDTRCHCRSRKHVRYIPHHIAGDTQRTYMLGDRPCTTDPCYNRQLSHVVVFHSRDYKPQPRWSMLDKEATRGTYIGFHTTTPEAAIAIVHSEFKPSESGMLGQGVYFARSIADTIGKAQSTGGACIIAQIQMGRVFEYHKQFVHPPSVNNPYYDRDLHSFIRSSEWHNDYDTCYMNHSDESLDEFCIKDPEKQIIKWIVVVDKIHDKKVAKYGMDTEFDQAECYCI